MKIVNPMIASIDRYYDVYDWWLDILWKDSTIIESNSPNGDVFEDAKEHLKTVNYTILDQLGLDCKLN